MTYACARKFVEEKAAKGEKLVNVRGANLSGGQKQRILIARALAAHPDILILDDSSSALDYRTDASLRKELGEHFKDTTTIMIAQRISSIRHADHIMVLEQGRVIERGSHEELMAVKGNTISCIQADFSIFRCCIFQKHRLTRTQMEDYNFK